MLNTNAFLIHFSRICLVFIVFVLFFVLPQINISGYIQPTITSKFIYFLYGCSALLGFYILYHVSAKTMSFSFSKLDIALFALVCYITINRYFIQPHFGFSIRYTELLGLSFLYIVLRSLSPKNYSWLLLAIVISGIFQAVYGNLQLLGYCASNHSGFKMTGNFFNPGPYAGFLVSVWTVALGMYLFKDPLIRQVQSQIKSNSPFLNKVIDYIFEYIPLLGIISIAIVLPATLSRAAWFAGIVGSVILLELRYNYGSKGFQKTTAKLHKIILMLLAIGILCVGLLGMYHYKKASSDGRAFIWKVTSEMIADNPIFGVGFDRFKAHYMNYQAHYFAVNGETYEALTADNTHYAFNEGLQFVSENGFLGLPLLLIVLLVLLQTITNESFKGEALLAKTGILTIGVFGCFSYPMQILPIKLVLVVLLVLLSNGATNSYNLKILTPSPSPGERGTVGFIVNRVIIALLACMVMYQTFSYTQILKQGFTTWNNAMNYYQFGDYDAAVTAFETAYPIFKKEGDFLMNYGKTLSVAEELKKAILILEQAKKYQNNTIIATALGDSYKVSKQYGKAEASYMQAITMTPSRFYAPYLLAKLYDESGQKEKAVTVAQQILNKKIKVPSTAIEEIQQEMKQMLTKYKKPLGFKN